MPKDTLKPIPKKVITALQELNDSAFMRVLDASFQGNWTTPALLNKEHKAMTLKAVGDLRKRLQTVASQLTDYPGLERVQKYAEFLAQSALEWEAEVSNAAVGEPIQASFESFKVYWEYFQRELPNLRAMIGGAHYSLNSYL